MVAVVPTPCSFKLRYPSNASNSTKIKVRKQLLPAAVVAFSAAIAPAKNSNVLRISNPYKPIFPERSLGMPEKSAVLDRDLRNHETKSDRDREVEKLIERLKAAVERVAEMEVGRFIGKVKGTLSDEEGMLIEEMSKNIAAEYLGKPIRYLESSCGGNLQEKMKDVSFLIGLLEESCLIHSNCHR